VHVRILHEQSPHTLSSPDFEYMLVCLKPSKILDESSDYVTVFRYKGVAFVLAADVVFQRQHQSCKCVVAMAPENEWMHCTLLFELTREG